MSACFQFPFAEESAVSLHTAHFCPPSSDAPSPKDLLPDSSQPFPHVSSIAFVMSVLMTQHWVPCCLSCCPRCWEQGLCPTAPDVVEITFMAESPHSDIFLSSQCLPESPWGWHCQLIGVTLGCHFAHTGIWPRETNRVFLNQPLRGPDVPEMPSALGESRGRCGWRQERVGTNCQQQGGLSRSESHYREYWVVLLPKDRKHTIHLLVPQTLILPELGCAGFGRL
jgi:hypothetical protein